MNHTLSVVVATKDRPSDLRNLLMSLCAQTVAPHEVVIVDASLVTVENVLDDFPGLRLRYVQHFPPSAAMQRNVGIRHCSTEATLIGFVDDDTTFEPEAFETMLAFWENSEASILGAAFNMRNSPSQRNRALKHSEIVKRLGLYSPVPGSVSESGWQTMVPELHSNTFVEWLSSCAVVFRRRTLTSTGFDEFYESYSYLEDLDFSYSLHRHGQLVIVADAGYYHFPSREGRVSAWRFGQYEVRNRVYFVRKHRLSLARCYLGLTVRWVMTLVTAVARFSPSIFWRACGNCWGLVRSFSLNLRP